MKKINTKIETKVVIFTEGNKKKWKNVISLGHLPIFIDKLTKEIKDDKN